jgi:hypothetical protein
VRRRTGHREERSDEAMPMIEGHFARDCRVARNDNFI